MEYTFSVKCIDMREWILAYGGVGIDLGLFLFGYRLMRNLGNNLTFLSPSRGLCLKMGSILTVLCATAIELPVSTTHCTTGATVVCFVFYFVLSLWRF